MSDLVGDLHIFRNKAFSLSNAFKTAWMDLSLLLSTAIALRGARCCTSPALATKQEKGACDTA
jgi:hypothetical protein